jgi:hypothetical protein
MLSVIKFPFLFQKLSLSDAYMHEFSNQRNSTRFLYYASRCFKKKIFVYSHGHSLNQVKSNIKNKSPNDTAVCLSFHKMNKEYEESCGYKCSYEIGFPKLYPEWINLLNNYNNEYFEEHIVIFSRQAGHPYYMDIDKFQSLLIEAYKAIRNFYTKNLIVIKPHPRENVTLINKIIKKEKMENVKISFSHAGVISKNAIMALSFFTSTVFDSLSLNVPTIEFYKEANNFRKVEPKGSLYKFIGIDSVDTKEQLEEKIESIYSKKYKFPPILTEFNNNTKNVNLSFFELC